MVKGRRPGLVAAWPVAGVRGERRRYLARINHVSERLMRLVSRSPPGAIVCWCSPAALVFAWRVRCHSLPVLGDAGPSLTW